MPKILIIEDDMSLSTTVQDWLRREHYDVEAVSTGEDGLGRLRVYKYDVIIVDWGLPGMPGIELCREFRSRGGITPILMLTGKAAVEEKTTGLDSGADDYLTKPFHPKELSARVRALLRRAPVFIGEIVSHGGIQLDADGYKLYRNGEEIPLSRREFVLVEFLLRNPGKVFSPEALVERLWPNSSDTSPHIIRNYIAKLRRKVQGENGPVISNVPGVGYRLDL